MDPTPDPPCEALTPRLYWWHFKMEDKLRGIIANFLLPPEIPYDLQFIILQYSHHLNVGSRSISWYLNGFPT